MKIINSFLIWQVIIIGILLISGILLSSIITENIKNDSIKRTQIIYSNFILENIYDEISQDDFNPNNIKNTKIIFESFFQALNNPEIIGIKVWANDSTILFSNNEEIIGSKISGNQRYHHAMTGEIITMIRNYDIEEKLTTKNVDRIMAIYVPIYAEDDVLGIVEIYVDPVFLNNSITKSTNSVFSLIGIVISIIVIIVIINFYNNKKQLIVPIKTLEKLIDEITKGNYDFKLKKEGYDEIKNLTTSFLQMQDAIKNNLELEKTLAIEKQKVKDARYVAIGELGARMAHDIRNPLSIIVAAIDNIKIKYVKNSKDVVEFDRLDRSVNRIVHQINDVLEFVKEQPMKARMTKFSEIISESFDSIIIPNNVKIFLPKNDVMIFCDKKLFSIVMNNLIINAIQAIGISGTIKIEIEKKDNEIIIRVTDSGKGIAKDAIDKIFVPLFTTKQSGTGLGLTSVKTIINNHKGTISATSPPTIFTITLPKIYS